MAAFRADPPEIVLTEVVMPDKCGIELIRDIKRENRDTRIIATSAGGALTRSYLLEVARKLGADLVLPKPFEIDPVAGGYRAKFSTGRLAMTARIPSDGPRSAWLVRL